jgi:hypothetical protein
VHWSCAVDSRYGILDISNPESPVIAYTNDTTFGASDAVFLQSGGKTYGYLVDSYALKAVDFSPLPNAAVVLSTPVASGVQRVTIYGHFLYVALDTGVLVFDLSSPGAPNQVQSLSFESDASAQTVAGVGADNNLYLVLTRSGADTIVRLYTIASSGILEPVAPYTIADFLGGELAMKGNVAIVANGADNLVPILLSDPAHPSLGTAVDPHNGKYDFEGSFGFSRMTVVNNYLAVYCTGDVVMARCRRGMARRGRRHLRGGHQRPVLFVPERGTGNAGRACRMGDRFLGAGKARRAPD